MWYGIYPLEVWNDIDKGITQTFMKDSEGQQLQTGINVTGKYDGNIANVVDDDDKRTSTQKRFD